MNPHISIPRQHGSTSNFGGTSTSGGRKEGLRMPRFFKRLFKFPQMDFEMAIWEMTSLLIAPKKVFRSIYYHVRRRLFFSPLFSFTLNMFIITHADFDALQKRKTFPPNPTQPRLLKLFSFCQGVAFADLKNLPGY